MKLKDIKKKLKKYPYVTSAFFYSQGGSKKTVNNQLVGWVKSGDIIRIKKGLYTLNSEDRSVGLSRGLVANILYYPSYVSLEYALSYYGVIPEAVFKATSVTPKKTVKFSNPLGEYIYKSVKRDVFFGYLSVEDEFGCDILMATPEKALLDFFYLKTPANLKISGTYFEESLRLQNTEQLNAGKVMEMAEKFKSPKVKKIMEAFLKWKKNYEHA